MARRPAGPAEPKAGAPERGQGGAVSPGRPSCLPRAPGGRFPRGHLSGSEGAEAAGQAGDVAPSSPAARQSRRLPVLAARDRASGALPRRCWKARRPCSPRPLCAGTSQPGKAPGAGARTERDARPRTSSPRSPPGPDPVPSVSLSLSLRGSGRGGRTAGVRAMLTRGTSVGPHWRPCNRAAQRSGFRTTFPFLPNSPGCWECSHPPWKQTQTEMRRARGPV